MQFFFPKVLTSHKLPNLQTDLKVSIYSHACACACVCVCLISQYDCYSNAVFTFPGCVQL